MTESKTKLLDAAINVVRSKGYTAARIEDVCAVAGVTKGSFFHHFKSKDDLALASVAHWDRTTSDVFAAASYHDLAEAADRVLGYIEFRKHLLTGSPADFSCLAGTMVQDVFETHPALREACRASIAGHVRTLEADIAEALRDRAMDEGRAPDLARHIHAVVQGVFVLAKADLDPAVAVRSLDHLSEYLMLLFGQISTNGTGA